MDFYEARDDGWQVAVALAGGKSFAPNSRQIMGMVEVGTA